MSSHLRANLWLLFLTLLICVIIYPAALWGIGQSMFPNKAAGSLIYDKDGKAIGSRLIAQPFTGEGYFQPRPSAVSYNGAASGASNWGANNYNLRDRVARQLGPIVKYRSGEKKGQLVGPDIESWFQKDQFLGQSGIVAQWAQAHSNSAQNWVKADSTHADFVTAWQQTNPPELVEWKKENPDNTDPKPEDFAVPFFTSFSKSHPGTFPGQVEKTGADGKPETNIEPVKTGGAIQSIFFDMWLQDNRKVELERVPADMVMASASGLDPHITVKNAMYQLDRVAAKRAADAKRDPAAVRKDIEEILKQHSEAPLGGLAGVEMVNVLEVNMALDERFGS